MSKINNVLVVTTNSIEGVKIAKYIKPISAHVVSGINAFNDFLGGLTDVFGGRSNTYQKQLNSLYEEAIFKIKREANELGANCVLGLKIDIDEISGKGKSMLMITAIGTAVILEKNESATEFINAGDRVSNDYLQFLSEKKSLLKKFEDGTVVLKEDVWGFIIDNRIEEFFYLIIGQFSNIYKRDNYQKTEVVDYFHNKLILYIDSLVVDNKINLLYDAVVKYDVRTAKVLINIMKSQKMFDFKEILNMLDNEDFEIKKKGLQLSTIDKLYYSVEDLANLKELQSIITSRFYERGKRVVKKQLLSKEKEVWECECGKSKSNEIEERCGSCGKDIYGFTHDENNPNKCIVLINEKINLLSDSLEG